VTVSVETLLRECALTYGHIQLFRNEDGWQASVCHYGPPPVTRDSKVFSDPAEALRKALMEDARKTADVKRRYERAISERQIDIEDAIAAAKPTDDEPPVDSDGFCMICENGGAGCDACNPSVDDDFEGMLA